MGLKRLCAIFMLIIMTITMTPAAYAATDRKAGDTIGTIDELKTECEQAEKDGTVSVAERTEILEEVTPTVYQEFRKEIFREATEAAEKITLTNKMEYDKQTDKFSTEKTINLESGGILTVKLSDEPDVTPSNNEATFDLLSWLIEPVYATNKAYGDRKYTATHYVNHFLYPDTKLVLAHYLRLV